MTPQPPKASDNPLSRVPPENVVHFQGGLPGFCDEKQFVILQNPEERPLAWMRSIGTPALAFVVISPFAIFPDYRPDVPDHELVEIGSPPLEEILVLSILRVISAQPPELHTNLKAPIIINLRTLAAGQVILANESMYSEHAVYRVKV